MKTDLSKAAFVVTYYPYGVKAKNWPAEAPKHKFLSHGPCNAARTLMQCSKNTYAMQQEHFRNAA
jgi:hypothetical protein